MIEVQHLTKRYGRVTAVDDVSFRVERGEILGFLGPNGAGKTTTMRILTGYIPATDGKAIVAGFDVFDQPIDAKRRTGYLPETPPLYPDMGVAEYLTFVAKIKGVPSADIRTRVPYVMERTRVTDMATRQCAKLSKGYRQRVGLAGAMIHDPRVLIMDEPTSGLDPNQIVEIRSLIQNLGKEKTVVLSTHILPEVQATCHRVVIINRGKIVADGPIEDLQRSMRGGERIMLEVQIPDGLTSEMISVQVKSIPSIEQVSLIAEQNGSKKFSIETMGAADIRKDLFQLCVQKGWGLLELHREQTSLEDIFRQLTSDSVK